MTETPKVTLPPGVETELDAAACGRGLSRFIPSTGIASGYHNFLSGKDERWISFLPCPLPPGWSSWVRPSWRSEATRWYEEVYAAPMSLIILAGGIMLAGYGLLVNTVRWDFSRLLGVYVAVFAVVSVVCGRFIFGESVPNSTWIGHGHYCSRGVGR